MRVCVSLVSVIIMVNIAINVKGCIITEKAVIEVRKPLEHLVSTLQSLGMVTRLQCL